MRWAAVHHSISLTGQDTSTVDIQYRTKSAVSPGEITGEWQQPLQKLPEGLKKPGEVMTTQGLGLYMQAKVKQLQVYLG